MMRWMQVTTTAAMALVVMVFSAGAWAVTPELRDAANAAAARGMFFLVANQQADGSWRGHPGITGLALTALYTSPVAADEKVAAAAEKGMRWLTGLQRADGSIYLDQQPNYNTSIAILVMVASRKAELRPRIARAQKFLLGLQEDEARDVKADDPRYGGIGYGTDKSADMSNMHYAMEALAASGLDRNSPAWEKAVVFLSRCQNLSATNDQGFASDDGGFVYHPSESKAGSYEKPDGTKGLRSYGGMTYAGLMSMIHAKVQRDDPRVVAAVEWIRKNWTLKENPGIGTDGLYYYYHTFAKALDAVGQDVFVDQKGQRHDWRSELVAELASRQRPDGSWVNENARWLEGDANLVTGYALLTLSYCRPRRE